MTAWPGPEWEDHSWRDRPWHGALDVDEGAVDALVSVFAECRELGIEVPALMPLGDPACQRAAVMYLSGLILRAKGDQRWQ